MFCKRSRRRSVLRAAIVGFGVGSSLVQAATFTWDAGGGNTNWSTGNNWLAAGAGDNTVPTSGSDVLFGTAGSSAVVDSIQTVGSIQLNRTGGFTISGSSALTINTGIGVTAAETYIISAPITLGATNTWTIGSGGTLSVSNAISDGINSFGLTVAGSGTLILSGTNTYDGATTLNSGILVVSQIDDSGGSNIGNAGNSLVFNGGTLRYIGTGGSGAGATARAVTLGTGGGTIDASGSGSLNFSNTGALTLSGSGTRTLTFTGDNTADNTFAADINDSGGATSIIKSGSGKWVLTGGSGFTGTVTLNGGTLQVADLTGSASNLGNNAPLALNGGYLRRMGTAAQSASRSWSLGSNGGGFDSSSVASGDTISFTGAFSATGTGNRTLTLTGTNTGANTISSVIADAGVGSVTSLLKSGSGTWVLSGANTYTGVTTVNSGVLSVTSLANGGVASPIGMASKADSNLVLDGGALRYGGGGNSETDRAFVVGPGGGTLDASGSGTVTLHDWAVVDQTGATGARNLTLTGTNTGTNIFGLVIVDTTASPISLIKQGSGLWVIPATVPGQPSNIGFFNQYRGATQILGGVLEVQADALGNGSVTGGLFSGFGSTTEFSALGQSNHDDAANLVLDGGTLRYNFISTATQTFLDAAGARRLFSLGPGGGTIEVVGNGPLNMFNKGNMGFVGSGSRVLTLTGTLASPTPTDYRLSVVSAIIGDGPGGATSIVKDGVGEWALTAAEDDTVPRNLNVPGNSYTGSTTVNAGKLMLFHGHNRLPTTTTLTINGTGELYLFTGDVNLPLERISQTVAAVGGSSTSRIRLGSGSFNVNNVAGNTSTYPGTIFDTDTDPGTDPASYAKQNGGSIAKLGLGTWILSGSNTYTGATTVTGGTLQFGSGGTTGSAGSGSIVNNSSLVFNRSNSYTVANNISGTGNIYQIGTGTTILSGTNSYTGVTTVNAGILQIATLVNGGANSGIGASGSLASNLVLSGGALRYAGSSTSTDRLFTLGTTGTLDASGSGSANFTNTSAIGFTSTTARVLTLAGSSTADNTLAAIIANNTGASGLTKAGTGKWIVTAANTYTGVTTINGGTLQVATLTNGGVAGPLGAATNIPDNLVIDGGTLRYVGTGHSTDHLFSVGANSGTIDASGSGSANFTNSGSLAMSGSGDRTLGLIGTGIATLSASIPDVSGSGAMTSLVKSGAGRWNLSGAGTYQGTTTISAGILQLWGGDDRLGTATDLSLSGGTLDLNSLNQTVSSISGAGGTIQLGSGLLTINPTSGSSSYSGVITGSGSVTKSGGGSQTLSGANSYSGTTTVSAGSLIVGVNNALPTSGTVSLTGGTLALGSNSQAIGTLSGTSNINLGSGSLTIGATSGTYSGVISGSGGNIVKSGTGAATFSGANSYTGVTTISGGGTLAVTTLANGGANSGIGASASTASNLVLNGGVVRWIGSTAQSSNRGFTIGASGGGFDASGSSSITLSGTMSAPAGGSQTFTLTGTSTTNNTYSSAIVNGTSGNVTSLSKAGGGKWILTNTANTYSGNTTISAGTLALAAASTNNIASSPTITVASGANLDVTALTGGGITLASASSQKLAGNGTVWGALTAENNSNTIAPGTSPGLLTLSGAGNVSWGNTGAGTSATVEFELGPSTTPGTDYDQIVVSHTAAKTLNLNGATLKLVPLSGVTTGTYTLVSTNASSASISLSSVFRNLDTSSLNEGGGPYTQGPLSFTIDYDATYVRITILSVPEPGSAFGLLALGLPALLKRRRRKSPRGT